MRQGVVTGHCGIFISQKWPRVCIQRAPWHVCWPVCHAMGQSALQPLKEPEWPLRPRARVAIEWPDRNAKFGRRVEVFDHVRKVARVVRLGECWGKRGWGRAREWEVEHQQQRGEDRGSSAPPRGAPCQSEVRKTRHGSCSSRYREYWGPVGDPACTSTVVQGLEWCPGALCASCSGGGIAEPPGGLRALRGALGRGPGGRTHVWPGSGAQR